MVMMMEKELKCNLTMGQQRCSITGRLPQHRPGCCPAETLIPDQQHLTVPLHQPLAVSCFSHRGPGLHLLKASAKDVKCFSAERHRPTPPHSPPKTPHQVPTDSFSSPACWSSSFISCPDLFHSDRHISSRKYNTDFDVNVWIVIKSLEVLIGFFFFLT